jgi:hypothetical protein
MSCQQSRIIYEVSVDKYILTAITILCSERQLAYITINAQGLKKLPASKKVSIFFDSSVFDIWAWLHGDFLNKIKKGGDCYG